MSMQTTTFRRAGLALVGAGLAIATTMGLSAPASADDRVPASDRPVLDLVRTGVISADEAQAIRRAIRDEHEEAHDQLREAALAPLVADGTLTAQEAALIVDRPRRLGLRELILTDQVTPAEARDIRVALRGQGQDDHQAVLGSALDALVADGTLTQEQADAVSAAISGRLAAHGAEAASA